MLLALAAFAVQPTCRDLTQQQPRRARPAATSGSIWDDMLMPPGRHSVCGKHKCYFHSARTPGTGYLVMRHEIAGDAWYFSNCLQQRYGVRHFLAAPTVVAKATDEMLSRLAKMHLVRHGTRNGTSTTLGSNISVIQSGSTMWVQKVRQAPTPKLFAACQCHKRRRIVKALPDFCAAVTDKEKFRRRVSESVQALIAAVSGDNCLGRDLQTYVDTEGQVHLIDVEQCFEHAKRRKRFANATQDAMRAAETRGCLGDLEKDLNDCLDPAAVSATRKDWKSERFRWHLYRSSGDYCD